MLDPIYLTARHLTCRECEQPFERPADLGGRPPSYCSPECRQTRQRRLGAESMRHVPQCKIEDCENRRRSTMAQWCETHYQRNYRYGSPLTTMRRVPDRTCYHCSAPVARRVRFCSTLCRRRYRMQSDEMGLTCIVCLVDLPEETKLGSMYCSKQCKRFELRASKYGLTGRKLQKLIDENPGCMICGAAVELVIDHCHDRKVFRGLLCGQCNVGIGMFADDPQRMMAAITYLKMKDPRLA